MQLLWQVKKSFLLFTVIKLNICAVLLKFIEIFESQNYMEKIKKIEEITRREMEGFSDERIQEIRIMGACVCVEVRGFFNKGISRLRLQTRCL